MTNTDHSAPAVPQFLYGTAWKENETQRLTQLAIENGFRGIDTANQRKHYFEAAVGQAVSAAIASGKIVREDLFLQTKFTFQRGQDHRLPYNSTAPIHVQVAESFESSLEHLGTTYIDSYVLHGPTLRMGLTEDDGAAWRAMESIHDSGRARWLGVSNVSLEQLRLLCQVRVRPRFVQNRCYAIEGWDQRVREFCKSNDIIYQGFSLLTANMDVLAKPELKKIAQRYNRTTCQIIFRFAIDVGMIPLTGTSNATHMKEDLDIFDFQLEPAEIRVIETLGFR